MRALFERILHEERGGMTILVIGFVPVAIALAAFVIDAANGFEHRRHLQLQADAGVLAAAQEMTRCGTDPAGANAAIATQASAYSGAATNAQIGGPDAQGRVRTVLNGSGYASASGSDGLPCSTGFIDLKLTEQQTPGIFAFINPFDVHAHARVEALRVQSSDRLLPIAAEDPVPRSAKAIFVDESTGQPVASTPLQANGSQGGLSIFDNSAAPVSVPITAEHIGVRIALSGKSTVGDCGQTLVACYDAGDPNAGIVHIRGWSAAGSVSGNNGKPLPRSVALKQGTCTDAYFSVSSSGCAVAVVAKVDFGVAPADAKLWATVGRDRYAMTYDATQGTWSSGAVVPVPAAAGPVPIGLDWAQTSGTAGGANCTSKGNNPCTGSLGTVQRSFGATPDRSGPIELAEVLEGVTGGANSLERCSAVTGSCTHGLVVRIGIAGTLDLSTVGGTPVRLRIVQGSQNQSLDCDPASSNLKDELAQGCGPAYTRNDGTPCPATPTALWSTAQPWPCVAVAPGNATNQIAEGLNTRILGEPKPSSCTAPNKWPDVRSGDPRVVYVIVTPFGSFAGNGSTTVPVLRLAAFYVTGWTGQGGGFQNPCLGQGDERPRDSAEIVGRFIKYVETPNTGDTSNEHCDLSSVDVCAAVLVQ